uniref:Uncharacterized protein n=1 Tax=Ditylenchus dipsaci TaxID=166011 RepID=A0A915D5A6_9BILA
MTCESCKQSSRRSSDVFDSSDISLPSLTFKDENLPIFDNVDHQVACVGFSLDQVKSAKVLPTIQWAMAKFFAQYEKRPWHPRAQMALNSAPHNIQRFGNRASHGTAYLIITKSTARKSKFSILYCGITGDNVNNAEDGNLAWSNRMSLHSRSKLFVDFKEIGFVKLLEGAPADKIRKWEWGMVYSKNLIDKRVTNHFEDYPSNDEYSINLLNAEYPYKDLNIASFSIEQANEYLDEAIAKALTALKEKVPIWREINQ